MNEELIAPCGMNCTICSGFLAYQHDVKSKGIRMPYCAGCRPRKKQCAFLKKGCKLLLADKVRYCYECGDFLCTRLEHLDERYKTNFGMSMIENLEYIRDNGIDKFLQKEQENWQCSECGGVICLDTHDIPCKGNLEISSERMTLKHRQLSKKIRKTFFDVTSKGYEETVSRLERQIGYTQEGNPK